MGNNIGFGRLYGIRIGAHWSFVFIFGLMTWTLAAVVLPLLDEGQPGAVYWAAAAVMAAVFFASLVIHEMAHALVARHNDIEVKEITLWLLGGVSKLESDALTARAELHIAVAGPLASFALGLIWLTVAVASGLAGVPDIVAGALAWLAFVNVTLAIFNLLPAFPLDGGRVLRAALWSRDGTTRMQATERAAQVGEVVAYGLMGLGFLEALSGGGIGGLWLVLIGWFVVSAGRTETEAVREQVLLEGLRVRDIMTLHPDTAPANLDVARFVEEYLVSGRHTAYPVVDVAGRTVGLVTVDRLRAVPPDRRLDITLGEVAIPRDELPDVAADDPAIDLVPAFVRGPATKVLVFDDDQLVGIVSAADLAGALHDRELRASFTPNTR